jgi:hypothetical protein
MHRYSYKSLFITSLFLLLLSSAGVAQQIQIERVIAIEPEEIGNVCTLPPSFVNADYRYVPQRAKVAEGIDPQNQTANFDISYVNDCEGREWPEAAVTAFDYAVSIWAEHLESSVPIRISASWTALGDRTLGSAGPTLLFTLSGDGAEPNTFYTIAQASAMTGEDLVSQNSVDFDIRVNMNCDWSQWYYGLDANPGPSQIDMVTVLLHEIGHGIGFIGSMFGDNDTRSADWGLSNPPLPIIYDQFALDGDFQNLIDEEAYINGSSLLYQAVTGQQGGVFFDGPESEFSIDNQRVRLYAPNPYQPGSSYSHLDQVTFGQSENSLMRPQLDFQFAVHSPGPLFCAMLEDMGWPLGSACIDLIRDDSEIQRPMLSLPGNGSFDQKLSPSFVWAEIAGADQYQIQISTDFNHSNVVFNDVVNGTSLTLPNRLVPDTRYFWRVRGRSGSTNGSWSNTFRFNTVIGIPEQVALLAPADGAENVSPNFTLQWLEVPGADNYRLQLSTDPNFEITNINRLLPLTSFSTSQMLDFSTKYYWRVRAENNAGESPWSDVWSYTTIIERPEPAVLSAPADDENQVSTTPSLTWEASERATNYRVEVSTDPEFSQLPVQGTSSQTTFTVPNPLEFATIYYWRVKAVNIGGESDWSQVGSFTTEVRETKIFPNYPNPFNSSTTLKYQLSEQLPVTIELYDIGGRRVAKIVDQEQSAGVYFVPLNASSIASGTYLLRFVSGDVTDIQKLTVIK